LNFDAKLRRQSIDPEDLLIAHIGGFDICAQALTAAAKLIEDGKYDQILTERYAGWTKPEGRAMLAGERSLEDIAKQVADKKISPKPRSGKQELIENLLNRYV
jgi:xylose isomerase